MCKKVIWSDESSSLGPLVPLKEGSKLFWVNTFFLFYFCPDGSAGSRETMFHPQGMRGHCIVNHLYCGHQILTKLNTYGGFWSNTLHNAVQHHHQNTKCGNIIWKNLTIFPVELQRLVESMTMCVEGALAASGVSTPNWDYVVFFSCLHLYVALRWSGLMIFYIFLLSSNPIIRTIGICLFLCSIDLHYSPKTIQKSPSNLRVAFDIMFPITINIHTY